MTFKPRQRKLAAFLVFCFAGILASLWFGLPYVRAAALILKVANPNDNSLLTRIGAHEVTSNYFEIPSAAGAIKARTFRPVGISNPPGMVIVHGVHELGIQEPRLLAFAQAMASNGILVLTPEVESLKDYQITPEGITVIGESARWLATQTGHPVGVMGLSFAGGLALVAAADDRYANAFAFVFAVGAHDDLPRVARFFATNKIEAPDGTVTPMQAHEYGPLVLVYAHPEDFFPPADMPGAAHAIQLDLYGEEGAPQAAAKLSPASRALLESLLKHDLSALRRPLLDSELHRAAEMEAVSPHGKLAGLHVPVLLLHGAGDNVIPPTETLWLVKEIPAQELKAVLVSKAVSHVEMENGISWRDKFRLISFMATVLKHGWRVNSLPLKQK